MSSKETFSVEIPPGFQSVLTDGAKDVEIRISRYAAEQQLEFLNKYRPKIKDVKGFWTVALLNVPVIAASATASDREALKALEDIELIQNPKDPRAYELVFHFGENDFFTNKSLHKKYSLPEGTPIAPEDGSIDLALRQFDPESLVGGTMVIDWKEGKNLVQQHPRKLPNVEDADVEDIDGDLGSFFHYFTAPDDMFDIGQTIVNEVLADPYAAFEGGEEDELDDDEEDDDDEGSVDLEDDEDEGRAKKRQRK